MAEKINMIQTSKNFEGTVKSFLRTLDNPQALGRYVVDTANEKSFFKNFPSLVYKHLGKNEAVGDIMRIEERFNVASGGPGLPGNYKQTRQLAGNESIMDIAFRRTKMTAWVTRHAVALENFKNKKLLPEQLTAEAIKSLSRRATSVIDTDIAATLFRDYPTYVAELDGLSVTEIDEDVLSMFGRGSINDVTVAPETIMPNGKSDIEDLTDLDTLSDVFVEGMQRFADQDLGMPALTLEDGRPFFGLMVSDADVQNFFRNSSTQFTNTMDSAFQGAKWEHPIYKKFINEYFGVRFTKYGRMESNDGRDEYADHMSVNKHIAGSPYEPRAKVLAACTGDETVSQLKIRDRGAYNLNTPGSRAGLDGSSDTYNLYVSAGATHFPFYSDDGDTTIGADSYNAKVMTNTETANAYAGSLSSWDLVGRMQIGEGEGAGEKFKILYTGPVFVWYIQIGQNKDQFTQVQSVYKLKIVGFYTRDGGAWVLEDDTGILAAFPGFKTAAGIHATDNVIQIGWAFGGMQYVRSRKVHIFNTVRSLLFGSALIYNADLLEGQSVEEEKRDYGAITGYGMTLWHGNKIAVSADNTIRSYAVVVRKKPPVMNQ